MRTYTFAVETSELAALLEEATGRDSSVSEAVQILTTGALGERPFDPGIAVLLVPATRIPSDPLPGRGARGADPVAILRALYPADQALIGLGDGTDGTVGRVDGDALESGVHLIPALEGIGNLASPHGLPWLATRLRAPGGCPWDRKQNHQSLKKYLLEEAYEVYDALDAGSTPALAEELGDLLLQIVLHAQYGAEAGVFDLTDVYRGIMTKIVRRHPHVFGDERADTAEQVMKNWERIKADERAAADPSESDGAEAADGTGAAAFRGLSRSLPALLYAQEMQERAAGLGYDWPDVEGVIDKLEEEAVELLNAQDDAQRREEFGDLLLVLVNLARRLGVDAEAALRAANEKFSARFARVERLAGERGVSLAALSLQGLDELWETAKAEMRDATEQRVPA